MRQSKKKMQENDILNVQLPEDRRVVKENEKVDKCQELVKEAQFEHREHRNNYCTDGTLADMVGVRQNQLLIGTGGRILTQSRHD